MEGRILKGVISTIEGNIASINPVDAPRYTSSGIVIPQHLRNTEYITHISKGDKVIYVEFWDNTGIIMERADGN